MATETNGDFVVAWTSTARTAPTRGFRPPLLERGLSPRRRVPGQHLHHEPARFPSARRRRRRRLRRGLVLSRPGRLGEGIFARRFSSGGVATRQRVPGQHVHHEHSDGPDGGDRTSTVTSSSPGRARPGRRRSTASSRAASRARARRWPASFRSTPTPLDRAASSPSLAMDADGDFVDGLDTASPGRLGRRRLRSPFLERRRRARRRVPGQHLHHRPTEVFARRALADGTFVIAWTDLVQDRSGSGVFARRFTSTGAGTLAGVPGQLLHLRRPATHARVAAVPAHASSRSGAVCRTARRPASSASVSSFPPPSTSTATVRSSR